MTRAIQGLSRRRRFLIQAAPAAGAEDSFLFSVLSLCYSKLDHTVDSKARKLDRTRGRMSAKYSMELFDFTFATPAENLACDEALLDACERNGSGEVLRFWEPHGYFVVVGYGNSIATEVNLAACEAERIPVLRRCSGGGTVLQGPGCLN